MGITDKARESKILIGMGYSATVGGLGTPIGSPPNILALGLLATLANIQFSFFSWFIIAFPITIAMLTFLYFNFVHGMDLNDVVETQKIAIMKSEPLTKNEKIVVTLFFTVVILWFSPGFVEIFLGKDHMITTEFKSRLPAGVVSIFFASLLFTLPLRGEKILGLDNALEIDWASLLLFGSGLSLGAILFSTGLANTIADGVLTNISGENFKYTMIIVVISTIYITEVISNTASANILIPIIIASCQEGGINPLAPVLVVAMACNLAFMLPVSTPPNAIVFGSRLVKMRDMIRAGFVMNLVSALILSGVYLLLLNLFG
jgi:sodium-dependent dicarboxylate transporter 2/3/5